MHISLHNSFYLWSISLPGNNGTPRFDLSQDECCQVRSENVTPQQILIERVIKKTFVDYSIPLDVSEQIRATFSAKLWRMGKLVAKMGTKSRIIQFAKWKEGSNSLWRLTIGATEVNKQLLSQKRSLEDALQSEMDKRKRLEQKIDQLQEKVEQQTTRRPHLRKPLEECTRQQQHNRKNEMIEAVKVACSSEGYDPCSLLLQYKDSGKHELITINKITASMGSNKTPEVHSSLYIKDKFSISNDAYHEISMLSNLSTLTEVRKLTQLMNSKFPISSPPNNVIGAQTNLRARLLYRIECLINRNKKDHISTPQIIRIKLTANGTRIARSLDVVNIAFTIIDEGCRAKSVLGNYSLAILKVSEQYEELRAGLADIISEAKDIEVLTIQDQVFTIQFYLGGDLKFLAIACGIESATAQHACVWCKCNKSQRSDMQLEWSISDPRKGARTIEEISEKCKLGK